MELVKILWCHDFYNGPMNGLAEYQNKKVWFRRTSYDETPFSFEILSLKDDYIEFLEKSRDEYAISSGNPRNWEDPIILKKKRPMNKMNFTQMTDDERNSLDCKKRCLSKSILYNHPYNPDLIEGDIICTISESGFSNYTIPHTFKYE